MNILRAATALAGERAQRTPNSTHTQAKNTHPGPSTLYPHPHKNSAAYKIKRPAGNSLTQRGQTFAMTVYNTVSKKYTRHC